MTTDSDVEGADGSDEDEDPELRAQAESAYLKFMRMAGTFRDCDELTAVEALMNVLDDCELSRSALAAGLAVFAVRAQRHHRPFEGHPTALAAEIAVAAQIAGNGKQAARLCQQALIDHPGTVNYLLMAWAAMFEQHATGGRPLQWASMDMPMLVFDPQTGARVKEEDMSPPVRWATNMLKAWLSGDVGEWDRLGQQLDAEKARQYLPTFLNAVTSTMKGLPGGWVFMDSIGRIDAS